MTNRESALSVLGVNVGPVSQVGANQELTASFLTVATPTISGYGVFTPISLSSRTTRAKDANLERNRR